MTKEFYLNQIRKCEERIEFYTFKLRTVTDEESRKLILESLSIVQDCLNVYVNQYLGGVLNEEK